jgi:hypothetical protein
MSMGDNGLEPLNDLAVVTVIAPPLRTSPDDVVVKTGGALLLSGDSDSCDVDSVLFECFDMIIFDRSRREPRLNLSSCLLPFAAAAFAAASAAAASAAENVCVFLIADTNSFARFVPSSLLLLARVGGGVMFDATGTPAPAAAAESLDGVVVELDNVLISSQRFIANDEESDKALRFRSDIAC